jgi:putative PIN family toxin of toxin-antitoxin system
VRAVLDPNVLVSALISPEGASARLLVELRSGAFELVTSELLLTELGEVLKRDKLRRYVTDAEVEEYVAYLRTTSIVLDDPDPPARPLAADPDDEYLISLARAARVDALVSGDTHLLELRDVIPALQPREFLDALERAD